MANVWINRLAVQGVPREIRAFAREATDPEILRRHGRRPWEGSRRLGLSFVKLLRQVPKRQISPVMGDAQDPWNVCVDVEERLPFGMARRVYLFELSQFEPDDLLVEASKLYRHLCFVLGWVEPNTDDQASRFIYQGRSWLYNLSDRRKRALAAGLDAELWELIEGDWRMLDAVMAHWDRKVRATLRRLAREDV